MKLTLQKLNLALLNAVCKCATVSGNVKAKQDAIERIVMLHTRMRVEKEQLANTLLFSNL